MDPQEFRDRFRRPTAKAALRGDPQARSVLAGGSESPPRPLHPIGVMNQPEIEFCIAKVEIFQWCKVGSVVAIAWHGQMVKIDMAVYRFPGFVCHTNQQAQIGRFHQMPVSQVAVTQVTTHERLLWHIPGKGGERLKIALERITCRLPRTTKVVLQF